MNFIFTFCYDSTFDYVTYNFRAVILSSPLGCTQSKCLPLMHSLVQHSRTMPSVLLFYNEH